MDFRTFTIASLAIIATTIGIYAIFSMEKDNSTYLTQFLEHKTRYQKIYTSREELEYRFNIFKNNMNYINQHNAQDKTFKLGENQFTDMTFEEFRSKYLIQEPLLNNIKRVNEGEDVKGNVDWRLKGKVSQVKNQAACGSCWAFSTTGSLESSYAIFKDKNIELSEQELVDCSRKYGNYGCMGGLMTFAFNYIKDHQIGTENDYPYKGTDGTCQTKSEKTRYTIQSYKLLDPVDITGLCNSIDKQPISVAIEVQADFMHYKSGVYVNDSCGTHLNHAVLAVGYNTDAEIPYFIIKNSWGTSWGDKGYILMKIGQGSGTCGIANNWDTYPEI